jgi:hypothetical protein
MEPIVAIVEAVDSEVEKAAAEAGSAEAFAEAAATAAEAIEEARRRVWVERNVKWRRSLCCVRRYNMDVTHI